MKLMITIGVILGSMIGGWLGSLLDHGNGLGGWSILFSGIGGLAGIWVGYRVGRDYF